jgi:ABC-type polysaccharide/polyol phosphate transport system ATPase subunit
VTGNGNTIFKATNVFINEMKQNYGLRFIEPNYFEMNKKTDQNFERWLSGSEFKLPSIYRGLEYRRDRVLSEINKKLESQHRLLLLGESGTSKSTLLMETLCDYFDTDYNSLQ